MTSAQPARPAPGYPADEVLTSSVVPSTAWAPGSTHLGASRRAALPLAGSPSVPLPPGFLSEIDLDLAATRLPARGRPELLEAIAAHLLRTVGLHLDPGSEVAVTNGAMQALDLVFRALIPRGATVAMLCPTFFADRLLRGHAQLVSLDTRPEDGWHVSEPVLARLRELRPAALLIVNPNNPTGVVYTEDELRALVDATARSNTLLVVDEAYEAFVYEGRRHVSVLALDEARHRVVTVQSFTKTFGLVAARVGCVFGPAPLLDRVVRLLGWVTLASNPLSQSLALAALRQAETWRPQLLAEFEENRHRLATAIGRGLLPPGTPLPEGGTFALLNITSLARDSQEAARRIWRETGIACVPGREFPGDPRVTDRFVRLPLGAPAARFEEALDRLATLFA